MKARELRQKTLAELKEIETRLLKESFNLQMLRVTGQMIKANQIKKVRREIARVYTIVTEKSKLL